MPSIMKVEVERNWIYRGFVFLCVMKKRSRFIPLVFAENYFINIEGYIFYKYLELKILPFIKNTDITVTINKVDYNLLSLMLEYFYDSEDLKNKKISYRTDKKHPLRISLRNIII